MKKITLLFILLTVSFGYSQTLPLDFETPTTWVDFAGGVVTTIANPQSNADNNSANVGQMVKNADQVYGGSSLVLDSALDFDANNTFSMKVYSIKAGTKVLLKVENSGNGGINYEKEVTMTTTNAWETLEFDYSGIPNNTYDKMTLIFDLNTMGDGSANFTYYFDDITLFDNGGTTTEVILPFDFSSPEQLLTGDNCTTSLTTDAGNDVLQIIGGGQDYDNAQIVFTQNVDLSDPANNTITFRVKAIAPLTSGSHLFKFEAASSGDAAVEVPFTTSGTDWQTISLDFDDAGGDNPGSYSKMVIFTDFANGESGTYLFDDIVQGNASGGGLSQIDLPVTFEGDTTNYTVTDFGGTASTLVVDPTDAGNMVIQTIKTTGAELWAGTTIGTNSGFATALPFTALDTKMYVRVWSPDAGIPVRMKVEDHSDGTHSVETETNTTVAMSWETLEFDFSNEATGTAALNLAFSYDKASIFFNFGTTGATAGEKTYYFDNVSFGAALSVNEFENSGLKVYPNPSQNEWNIQSVSIISSVEVYDVLGKQIFQTTPNALSTSIDATALPKGLYFIKILSNSKTSTIKLIKN